MKVQIDGKEVYSLNETKKKVIQNDIPSEIFVSDMERRARYIVEHKYERCLERLKLEWEPKLRERVQSIPTDQDALAELIFSQPDYKSRSVREAEAKAQEHRERTGQ